MRGAGINPVNTLHEKYKENVRDIKQFQTTSRYQTSSRGFQQTRNGQNRTTSINVSSNKADRSPIRDRLPHLQMELQRTLLQRGPEDMVLNEGVQGIKPLYRTKINEVSTPLIKNKRRFGAPRLAHEIGSVDGLSKHSRDIKERNFKEPFAKQTKVTKLKQLGGISNSQAFNGALGSIATLGVTNTSTF